MPAEAVSVIIAVADCPGASVVSSWFQVTVICPLAWAGDRLSVVIESSIEAPAPVFLM